MPALPSTPTAALRAQALAAAKELLAGVERARGARGEGDEARAARELTGDERARLGPALAAAVLRMVFVLLAEEEDLLPAAGAAPEVYTSLTGLHRELREEARRGAKAMEDRSGAWGRVTALFDALHRGPGGGGDGNGDGDVDGGGAAAHRGRLFDPAAHPLLDVPDAALLRALDRLVLVGRERIALASLGPEHLGSIHEGLMGFEVRAVDGALALVPTEERRRFGAHYTSRALTRAVVERTLAPLLPDSASPADILDLALCDPAMGSGAFLLEACRQLAAALVRAWERAGETPPLAPGETPLLRAKREVATRCLHGVDKNPLAVDLAALSLWLETRARALPFTFLGAALRAGDSLSGLPPGGPVIVGRRRALVERAVLDYHARHPPLRWEEAFPPVFAAGGGFDAILGNPPWVSYAGRAAQPIADEHRAFYLATSEAFAGYRNLQGIFVERAAQLLRPGGRLGLVLPTSMSDLAGYAPSRRAHDRWCQCDPELPDFGDAFDDVFQPSMALLSTRRAAALPAEEAAPWPLERRDLDAPTAALLDHLRRFPVLPPHLFGERGLQTMGGDVKKLAPLPHPEGRYSIPLRVGADVEPFTRKPPGLHCDPADFEARLRPAAEWQSVKLLLRQTARYPMAALSDGAPFRNSILAAFEDPSHPAPWLLAYLNSSPIRWFHYHQHRDARQGMPQLKIGHLRALPDAPPDSPSRQPLEELGRALGARNAGITPEEQSLLDSLVGDALSLDPESRALVAAWAALVKG